MFFEEFKNQYELNALDKEKEPGKEQNNALATNKEKWSNRPNDSERFSKNLENIQKINEDINRFRNFFNDFPNNFHEETNFAQGENMLRADSNNWAPEQKIKWFEKTFGNGKSVKVKENDGTITFEFFDENNPNPTPTKITLSNFNNLLDESWNVIWKPRITKQWSWNNLPDSIIWAFAEFPWSMSMELSKDNAENFINIFNVLKDNIIQPKIQEFHGYAQRMNELLSESSYYEEILDSKLFGPEETELDTFIKTLLENSKWIENDDLIARKVLLSICILLRNSSNNLTTIKQALWFTQESAVWKEKTLQWGEDLIEFLQITIKNDIGKFIACKEELIQLAIEELTTQKQNLRQWRNYFVASENDGEKEQQIKEIQKILEYLI